SCWSSDSFRSPPSWRSHHGESSKADLAALGFDFCVPAPAERGAPGARGSPWEGVSSAAKSCIEPYPGFCPEGRGARLQGEADGRPGCSVLGAGEPALGNLRQRKSSGQAGGYNGLVGDLETE